VINRGVVSEIAPNKGDHLECDECGACIDICPVGALTSGAYRYKTRPWEMTHVGTICAHCSDGCRTTLGVRNDRIIRGTNRDRSGINGEFLCIKGRYGFDFYDHPERLQAPLMRVDGELKEASWAQALKAVAEKFNQTMADGGSFGVIGSNHTTNEENFYLQKFAREVLRTNHIDHHRTGDLPALLDALSGTSGQLATVADLYQRKAFLILGADLALEHPLLSYQIRANYRHHRARIYVVTPRPVREDQYAAAIVRGGDYESLREQAPARARTGHPVRRLLEGRRDSQAGGVRRIAGHPGEVHLPAGLLELARRAGHGADAGMKAACAWARCWRRN
jgi:NADH-quinone oxidoreductase subunit G